MTRGKTVACGTGPQRQTPARPRYGTEHKRLRKRMAVVVASGGALCARCGQWMEPDEPWDLGHHDHPAAKRLGMYRGP